MSSLEIVKAINVRKLHWTQSKYIYFYSIKNILYLFFFFLFNVEYIDLGNTISNLISTDSLCFSFMPSFFIYSSGALLLYCLIGKSSLIKSLFLVSTIASAYASNTILKFIGEVEYVLHCINTLHNISSRRSITPHS